MGKTNIGWTNETWNPVTGCSHVSPGCEHCYAETLSLRHGWTTKPWTKQNAGENVVVHESRLLAPLSWRKPRMVFVNSMSDLFHERVPDEFIARVFAVMGLRNIHTNARHTYQVLTKRPERMRRLVQALDPKKVSEIALHEASMAWGPVLASRDEWWKGQNRPYVEAEFKVWPLPNVWLGVSVEDQRRADERIPLLLETPVAVRFLSCEPLLGPIDLVKWIGGSGGTEPNSTLGGGETSLDSPFVRGELPSRLEDRPRHSLAWCIVGGESGPGYRPMELAWLENVAAECAQYDVPLFVKQDSGARPGQQGRISDSLWSRKDFPVTSSLPGTP